MGKTLTEGLFRHETPIRVRWKGFESNTYALCSAGWRLFAAENFFNDLYAHVITVTAVSPEFNGIALYGTCRLRRQDLCMRLSAVNVFEQIGIEFQVYRAKDDVRVVHNLSDSHWRTMNELKSLKSGLISLHEGPDFEYHSMSELGIFQYDETKSIYLAKAGIDQCLEHILMLQSEEKVDPERKTKMQAKIYSLEE